MILKANFHSIRSIVTSIIIVMGVLGLTATLITGQIYHRLTLKSQLENIQHLLAQESNNELQRLKQFSLQLGTVIINSGPFSREMASAETGKYLRGLQQSPFLQNGALNLSYLFVYNKQGNLLHGLEYVNGRVNDWREPLCSKKLAVDMARVAGQEMMYDICEMQGKPFFVASLPYQSNAQIGHLLLISNISSNFTFLERQLNFPIRVVMAGGSVVFSSTKWPRDIPGRAVARYQAEDNDGKPIFYIDAVHQDRNLDLALSDARVIVISGAAVLIVLAIIFSLRILRQTVISPVNDVVKSLRMVREHKDNIGAQVKSRGADEIIELMDDFNAMSKTLQQLYQALEKMAYTDALTRLGNRKLFHEKLQYVLTHAEKTGTRFAILIIDLDKFKQVNDKHGHQTGDLLLNEISNRLSEVVRNLPQLQSPDVTYIASPIQDHLARLGGDEFGVILPSLDAEDEAVNLAQRLMEVLSVDIIINNARMDVGMSIGAAVYPTHGLTIEQLIHCADVAMYQAKQNGTCCKLYSVG